MPVLDRASVPQMLVIRGYGKKERRGMRTPWRLKPYGCSQALPAIGFSALPHTLVISKNEVYQRLGYA